MIFVGGYLSTTLVLLAVAFGIGRFLGWKRKRSVEAAGLSQISFKELALHKLARPIRPKGVQSSG